jgi:NAD(P)H dehydrogenase (quinone)
VAEGSAASALARRALLVSVHPEPRSFHAALRAAAVEELDAQGYAVQVSDLYAMGFKATLNREDFRTMHDAQRLNLSLEQRYAWTNEGLAPDIASELRRLLDADLLLLLFPLWWFGMPALLKGWIDRVFVSGAVYGRSAVFERGRLRGKRALVGISTGAPAESFGRDALNGDIHDILMPLHRGVLGFTGMTVLPPFIAYHVPYIGASGRAATLAAWRQHLRQLDALTPLAMPRLIDYPDALAPSAQAC